GQVARGLEALGDPSKLSDADLRALMDASSHPGGEELHAFFKARKEASPVLFGRPVQDLELASDGVYTRSVLRLDRFDGQPLDVAERTKLLHEGKGEIIVYLDDRSFSMNRHDFEVSGNGTVAELARSPTMSWK